MQNIEVTLEADTDDETLREWTDRVEERCSVSDDIKNETDVRLSVGRD